MSRLLLFFGLIILFGPVAFAEPPVASPVTIGLEGQRAFDDLGAFYDLRRRPEAGIVPPDFVGAIRDLDDHDERKRISTAKYLLALLDQSVADESNGRAGWSRAFVWNNHRSSQPWRFRSALAKHLTETSSNESLDVALWFIDRDPDPKIMAKGALALCRVQSTRSGEIFKRLLTQPHPCQPVTVTIIEEVGKRRIEELKPDLIRLTTHYRTRVREAARRSVIALGEAPLPDFNPATAFTPWLDERMEDISRIVLTKIPQTSRWVQVKWAPNQDNAHRLGQSREIFGWLLDENDKTFRLLTWSGSEDEFEFSNATWKPVDLTETTKLLAKRNTADPPLTEEIILNLFGPNCVDLQSVLVAAWCHTRGDKQSAAEALFPCIDRTADDRWVFWGTRDQIGHEYHQLMLNEFSDRRDYGRALVFARHLTRSMFEGYMYQQRARELAVQLPKRRDDFGTFKLLSKEEWSELRSKLSREEQVKYLAAHLRLLNCCHYSYGSGYLASQTSDPPRSEAKPCYVINPYIELMDMHLAASELPPLVPFLADNTFMPTYSFYKIIYPTRELHRVKWAVAGIINEAAQFELVKFDQYYERDEDDQEVQVENVAAWIRENSEKTRAQLFSEKLSSTTEWWEFKRAAIEVLRLKLTSAHAILARRMPDFPKSQHHIAEICHLLNAPESATDARLWIDSAEDKTRFWAALILLENGDKSKLEGLDVLADVLSKDDGAELYARAIEPLLATKAEPAVELALGILRNKHFTDRSSSTAGPILHRLFLLGRQECLDILLTNLSNKQFLHDSTGDWNGMSVTREWLVADMVAGIVMSWRTDRAEYESQAPDHEREVSREHIKTWLTEQFSLVKHGRPNELKPPSRIVFHQLFLYEP